jgi:hypothetical protein
VRYRTEPSVLRLDCTLSGPSQAIGPRDVSRMPILVIRVSRGSRLASHDSGATGASWCSTLASPVHQLSLVPQAGPFMSYVNTRDTTALHFTTAGCHGHSLHHGRLPRPFTSPRPVATAIHFTTAGCHGPSLHHGRLPRPVTSPRPVATALHFTTAGCHGPSL